jgi:hypothetical protein
MRRPSAAVMRSISNQVTREGHMMKVRSLNIVAVVFVAAVLGGCVSYGNTHALITPLGVAGYHKFKPENTSPVLPPPTPDRMTAATEAQKQNEQQGHDGEF